MKILIFDKMQIANGAPDEIKSPALDDIYTASNTFTINFDEPEFINCIGIGNTDATEITIEILDEVRTINITRQAPEQNGLYLFAEIADLPISVLTFDGDIATLDGDYWQTDLGILSNTFIITHNGTYIGRVGIGEYRKLGVNPTMEIGFYTTNENRVSGGGQPIPGAGGYSGRRFEADVRYKLDEDVYNDIEAAFIGQISRGFPYFLLLDDEQHKVPANMLRFYASTNSPISMLQSSTYEFLYSYKFSFRERF